MIRGGCAHIRGHAAKSLLDSAVIFSPGDHCMSRDIRAWTNNMEDELADEKQQSRTSQLNPMLIDLVRRQCRVWVLHWRPFEGQEVVIALRFTEELDDARLAYRLSQEKIMDGSTDSLGDHYLRLLCSGEERPLCCHDKFGGPSMHNKLESLLLATKAAASKVQTSSAPNVKQKYTISPFFDVFINANGRHHRASKLSTAILLLDSAVQKRSYGLIWNGSRRFRGRRRPFANELRSRLHFQLPEVHIPKFRIHSAIRNLFVESRSVEKSKVSVSSRQDDVKIASFSQIEDGKDIHYEQWIQIQKCKDKKSLPPFSAALNGVSLSILNHVPDVVQEKEDSGLKLNLRAQRTEKDTYNPQRQHILTFDPHPSEKGKGIIGQLDKRKACKCVITWDERPLPVRWEDREYFSEDEDEGYQRVVIDTPAQSHAKLLLLHKRQAIGCTDDFPCEPCEWGMVFVELSDTKEVVRVLCKRDRCIMHRVSWVPLENIIYQQMNVLPLPQP